MKTFYTILTALLLLNCQSDDNDEDFCLYRMVVFADCECTENDVDCTSLAFVLPEEKERIEEIFNNSGTTCVYFDDIQRNSSSDPAIGYIRSIPSECIGF